MNLAGQENAGRYKKLIWLAGSASAEFFADIALCPLEMVKVKIQTSKVGTFPTTLGILFFSSQCLALASYFFRSCYFRFTS